MILKTLMHSKAFCNEFLRAFNMILHTTKLEKLLKRINEISIGLIIGFCIYIILKIILGLVGINV